MRKLLTVLALVQQQQKPAAFVFLDLTAAFYSVLQQSLFGHKLSDPDLCLCAFLRHTGVSSAELKEWGTQIQTDNALRTPSDHVSYS